MHESCSSCVTELPGGPPGTAGVDPSNDAFRLGVDYVIYGLTH